MSTSQPYEFLSAFKEWERQCLRDASHVDKLPMAATPENWTEKAHILGTLMGYKGLDSAAKNGVRGQGGYPALLKSNLKPAHNEAWSVLFAPSPADLAHLPYGSVLLKVALTLRTPFYSRDDRAFYPTENPLKRQWAFHVPYLAAAGIKGLLGWAYRMAHGHEALDATGETLFGVASDNEKDTSRQGTLFTYPLFWNGFLGLDFINPQNRSTGAGTQPIKYEVILPGAEGDLYLLLAVPHTEKDGMAFTRKHMPPLLRALHFLLENGGLSAKKSADWGSAAVQHVNVAIQGIEGGVAASATQTDAQGTLWAKVEDANGDLLPYDAQIFVSKVLKELTGWSNSQIKDRDATYAEVQRLHALRHAASAASASESAVPTVRWLWEEGKGPTNKAPTSLDALSAHLNTLPELR